MIVLSIIGEPKPGGSKRHFINPKTNKVVITDDCAKNKQWRKQVEVQSLPVCRQGFYAAGIPLEATCIFYVERPQGHFKKDGSLKPNAPEFPTVRPDATKLFRSTEDALTGVAWSDDAQVVRQIVEKRYCWEGRKSPGADIWIRRLDKNDRSEEQKVGN